MVFGLGIMLAGEVEGCESRRTVDHDTGLRATGINQKVKGGKPGYGYC